MHVAIVGAGYVGLVTAACLAHLGHDVVCVDVDARRVARLRQGHLPLHEPGLDELVAEGLASGRLAFAADAVAMRGAELVIVCVGTLDPDEEWNGDVVEAAVLAIAADASLPRAIVIRSTLLPGTASAHRPPCRRAGRRVRLAHNPEFTREASAVATSCPRTASSSAWTGTTTGRPARPSWTPCAASMGRWRRRSSSRT